MEPERDAPKVFGLFVETLVIERDTADASLLSHLTWYADDVRLAADRLKYDPRAGRDLMIHLEERAQELVLEAIAAETLEENVHQARRWRLVLSVNDEDDGAAAAGTNPS